MCKQIDSPVKQSTSRKRRRLWEVSDCYHCSILGTCLSRVDLKRFAKKKLFQIESRTNDYQVHTALVGFSSTRNAKSRALNKILDQRYRAAVKRYTAMANDEDVLELWKKDLKRGAIAGAYWAIMTNRFFSSDTRSEIYGQNHMLGHDTVSVNQHEQRLNQEVANKAAILEEVLVSERQLHLQKEKAWHCERTKLKKGEQKVALLTAENQKLSIKIRQLESVLAGTGLSIKIAALKTQLAESNTCKAGLYAELKTLKRALEKSHDQLDQANVLAEEMKSKNILLSKTNEVLQSEVLSMEKQLHKGLSISRSCVTCGDQNTNRCPGPDLCGKTILYVGGLHKMVSHYKHLIENHGGKFLHHDGGKEASRSILPKMLSTADAVLCPVDCVSHDACTCVKKICKRYQKPYVMMRSSGLSSLAKGLSDIVQ